MKRRIKGIICAILATVMILSVTTVAFAKNDVTPVIVIHGIVGTDLHKDVGTDKEQPVSSFSVADLFTVYNDLLKSALAAANGEKVDPEKMLDGIADIMKSFTDISCDTNGNPKENVTIDQFWDDSLANHQDFFDGAYSAEPGIAKQIADNIGAENVYYFKYDWRLDACENADKLNGLIDKIKADTGKSKVSLVSCSEGTVVASAYIDKYMSKNDIDRTIFVNGAFQGVGVTKMFAKDIVIDKKVVLSYLKNFLSTSNNSTLRSMATITQNLDGAVDNLCKLLKEIQNDEDLYNKMYNDVLYPVFGCIPIYWEFVPYDSFDKAVKEMSAIGFLDKSSGLYKKLANYHKVQGRLESNLNKLKSKGVGVAVVANYNFPAIPVTSSYADNSDTLIETVYASVGAKVADYGKTLSGSGKYISPDKVINASTCALPDNTWFFKDLGHVDFIHNTEATIFLANLVTADTKLDINSVEKATGITQFIGTDSQQNIISITKSSGSSSVTATADEEKKSPLTGSSDVLIAGTAAFIVTLFGMFTVIVLKKKLDACTK